MKQLFRVISQSETVNIQKQDGSTVQKSTLVLQEIGGKYENSYACSLLGTNATMKFYANELVYASLRFSCHPSPTSGQYFQDITVQEVVKLTP